MDGNYGKSFWEYTEDEERERKFYQTVVYDEDEGEIELQEYTVDGAAYEVDSYKYTGNRWDIIYSQNTVKKQ